MPITRATSGRSVDMAAETKITSILVYCVRHGQTAENLRGIIQGQMDTKLDETGVEQAAAVAHALKDTPFDVSYTSDLARATNTAEAILQYHAGVELCKTSILRERDMGNLQGQAAWSKERRPVVDETVEGSSAFVKRTLQFWDQMIIPQTKSAAKVKRERPYNVLVVSHGAFINTLARSVVGHRNIVRAPGVMWTWCPNTSITLIEVQGDGAGTLLNFGDISHLEKPAKVGNVDELPL